MDIYDINKGLANRASLFMAFSSIAIYYQGIATYDSKSVVFGGALAITLSLLKFLRSPEHERRNRSELEERTIGK